MLLLIAVVGSGIMGARLSPGNDAIALLANSLATGGALIALIGALGPISGAHFNPAVTLFELAGRRIAWQATLAYIPAQLAGAIAGVVIAHAMFALPLLQTSGHARDTGGEFIGEIVATFGLLLTIWGTARAKPDARAGGGRRLHHRRLLVHLVDLVRQPCRHHRPRTDRHVLGHSARIDSAVPVRANHRARRSRSSRYRSCATLAPQPKRSVSPRSWSPAAARPP